MVVSSGDAIVMFTDGITEARNRDGELFGKKRLCECLEDAVVGSARQISDVIVETVQAFIDPLTPRDDITTLVVKVL
jgi:sigma-B regulation protein RsbU (phosphoserine phosphatase)